MAMLKNVESYVYRNSIQDDIIRKLGNVVGYWDDAFYWQGISIEDNKKSILILKDGSIHIIPNLYTIARNIAEKAIGDEYIASIEDAQRALKKEITLKNFK